MHYRETKLVSYRSDDAVSVMLANPAAAPFVIDGARCASAEGFASAILFPPDHANHARALTLAGTQAERIGDGTERQHVWWHGRQLAFGSDGHEALLERAMRAKFEQNPGFMRALRGTGNLHLYTESADLSARAMLRPGVEADILMRLRDDRLPRWPRGSHAEPLEVKVQPRPHGAGFTAWVEDSHRDAYWRFDARTAEASVGGAIGLFVEAHDRCWFTVTHLPCAG